MGAKHMVFKKNNGKQERSEVAEAFQELNVYLNSYLKRLKEVSNKSNSYSQK